MKFTNLSKSLVKEAITLALGLYDNEVAMCYAIDDASRNVLPNSSSPLYDICQKSIENLLLFLTSDDCKNAVSVAALTDDGTLAGYIIYPFVEIPGFFGVCKGAYSPLFASGFRDTSNKIGGCSRGRTASLLFEKVATQLTAKGVTSFALTICAHDREILESFSLNGFGIRCTDAIKIVDSSKTLLASGTDSTSVADSASGDIMTTGGDNSESFDADNSKSFGTDNSESFKIIPVSKVISGFEAETSSSEFKISQGLYDLWAALGGHLEKAPTFYSRWPPKQEQFIEMLNERSGEKDSRFFIFLDKDGNPGGYIQLFFGGENAISEGLCSQKRMAHICGAYMRPEFRGKGIAKKLLRLIEQTLEQEKIELLGVDCETLNPTALNFWGKYFTNYTYSVHRRIDERCLYSN